MKRWLSIVALALIAVFLISETANAKGGSFSGGRSSFSSPSRSYSAPRPSYTPPPRVQAAPAPTPRPQVIRKTTVIQQNVTHVAPASSSGGGFFAPFLGAMGGSMLGNWFSSKDDHPPAQPQPQVAQPLLPASAPQQPKE